MNNLVKLAEITCGLLPGWSILVSDITGFKIVTIPETILESKFNIIANKKIAKHKREEFLK